MNLLGFMGAARAGKSSASNFVHGYILKKNGKTDNFEVREDGKLWVNATELNPDGTLLGKNMFLLDIESPLPEFTDWAKNTIWKLVKSYSFAWPLKQSLMNVFGLTYEHCYGNGKNELTDIKWEQICQFLPQTTVKILADKQDLLIKQFKQTNMTAREVMEYFAEYIFRKVDENVFVDRLVERVKKNDVPLAVVTDVRKAVECQAIQKNGGRVIKLTKRDGELPSESSLDDCTPDLIIPNHEMKMDETHHLVLETLTLWGYV